MPRKGCELKKKKMDFFPFVLRTGPASYGVFRKESHFTVEVCWRFIKRVACAVYIRNQIQCRDCNYLCFTGLELLSSEHGNSVNL